LKLKVLCPAACDNCPDDDDVEPTNPTKKPTKRPTKKPTKRTTKRPTNKPTNSPVSDPVSPPTGGGGSGVVKEGKATFYGGNPSGNACGYNDLPQVTFPHGFSVAIGGEEFKDGYGCGACFEVTCIGPYGNNPSCFCGDSGKNKVIVQATDQCPECGSTHFDLNSNAFTSIVAGQSSGMAGTCGVLETQLRRVSCNFESNIKIRSKSGTSGFWYGLHVDDVSGYGAIQQIKLREEGRRESGKNTFDIICDKSQGASFWICNRPNNRQIFAPLDVELTDSAGRILKTNNVITNLSGNQEFDFRKNFGPIDGDNDESPVATPTSSPVSKPTKSPVPAPSPPPPTGGGNGCCSLDYKNCVDWCGSSYDSCMNCDNNDVTWLSNGPQGQCTERWGGCDGNPNGCCDGLTCQWRDGYGYNACLPNLNPTPAPVPAPPTKTPTYAPTIAPVPTISPAPTPEASLLSTDKAMNAWDVFLGLDYITHKNSANNYALVASGGAAGGGNLVVSESQAYGLLITGTILASWDTHAGKVPNSSRSEVLKYFEGYYNFWKQMCKDSWNENTNCQSDGNYCKDSNGGSSVCLPDWRHYKTGGSESTGPAPDADEDAIVGIMLAVKAVENDKNKPSWYDEARNWADASATAFYKFEVDKSKADYPLVKLGSCWGGWEEEGNNPSYHSPGSFRVMKDYQKKFPNKLRKGYNAVSQSDWKKLIDTSHEVLRAVQCSDDGALVPNWATIGVSGGKIIHSGGSFSGSGTPQYEYGAEAARTTFRVALDAAFYPKKSDEWSPYLSSFNWMLDGGFQNGSFSSNTFPSCRGPNTNQNINMFGGWLSNEFITGPTFSALIAASSDIGNAEAMIDAAGTKMAQSLPGSYYPRSWAMISNLMLNGAMESAGNTLKK